MLIPLHVICNVATPQCMFVAWTFYVVAFFSMHYHLGVAFGVWDPIFSVPRKLDITVQILSFPFFAYASSGGNSVFTLTCVLACIVPLFFAWVPPFSTDGSRWRVNAVLSVFVTCGLLLQGSIFLFIFALFSSLITGLFFSYQEWWPGVLCFSRLGIAAWIYIISLGCQGGLG